MAFHRLTVPTYGSLPSGFDYINDPVTNGDAGVAAPADGKKSSGVNAGTYFIAFGEDATASNVNRAISALAANTDYLDDVVHGYQTVVRKVDVADSGSPVSTFAVSAYVWVGSGSDSPATANDQDTRDRIIKIVDQNDNELEVSGVKVKATLIHDGASNNVVGQVSGGFRNGASVDVSPSIPAGVAWRYYYAGRQHLQGIVSAKQIELVGQQIHNAHRVTAEVRGLLRSLHAASGQTWDAAWDASIQALASSGLNERYRRQTTVPAGYPNYDTPGDGATILRDGPAPTVQSRFGNSGWTASGRNFSNYVDPYQSAWRAELTEGNASGAAAKAGGVGSNGYVALYHRYRQKGESYDVGAVAPFLGLIEHDKADKTAPAGTGYFTYVEQGADATIQQDTATIPGTSSGDGVYRVTLTGTGALGDYYFWVDDSGTKRTSITVRKDMLRIVVPSVGTFVATIVQMDTTNDNQVLVRFMDGGNGLTGLPTTTTPVMCEVTLLTCHFHVAAGAPTARGFFQNAGSFGKDYEGNATPSYEGLYLVEPPPSTTDAGATYQNYRLNTALSGDTGNSAALPYDGTPLAYFGAGVMSDAVPTKVIAWGAFQDVVDQSGSGVGQFTSQVNNYRSLGMLMSDGGMWTRGGRQRNHLTSKALSNQTVSATSSKTWNPKTDGSFLRLAFNGNYTCTLDIATYVAEVGALPGQLTSPTGTLTQTSDTLYLLIDKSTYTTATMTWPAQFLFSGSDGNIVGSSTYILFEFHWVASVGKFFATRIDY